MRKNSRQKTAVPEIGVKVSSDLLDCLNALIATSSVPDKTPTAFFERMISEKWYGPAATAGGEHV